MKIVDVNNSVAIDVDSGQFYKKQIVPHPNCVDGFDIDIRRSSMNLQPICDYDAFHFVIQEDEIQIYTDIAANVLGETLFCNRVWEAWGYGTMSSNDFQVAADDQDYVGEKAIEIWKATNLILWAKSSATHRVFKLLEDQK